LRNKQLAAKFMQMSILTTAM